jgi:hypothetical protein
MSSKICNLSAPRAARTLLQDSNAPRIDHVAVLGFSWHSPTGHIAVLGSAAHPLPPHAYSASIGFAVPKHHVTKHHVFSLTRALGSSSSGSSGSGRSSGGLSAESGSSVGSGASSAPGSSGADSRQRTRRFDQVFHRTGRLHRSAAATDAAAAAAATAAEGEGWWKFDVGGYTCKGYIAGGGKEINQDRWAAKLALEGGLISSAHACMHACMHAMSVAVFDYRGACGKSRPDFETHPGGC